MSLMANRSEVSFETVGFNNCPFTGRKEAGVFVALSLRNSALFNLYIVCRVLNDMVRSKHGVVVFS